MPLPRVFSAVGPPRIAITRDKGATRAPNLRAPTSRTRHAANPGEKAAPGSGEGNQRRNQRRRDFSLATVRKSRRSSTRPMRWTNPDCARHDDAERPARPAGAKAPPRCCIHEDAHKCKQPLARWNAMKAGSPAPGGPAPGGGRPSVPISIDEARAAGPAPPSRPRQRTDHRSRYALGRIDRACRGAGR